jgi:hypothetical protein
MARKKSKKNEYFTQETEDYIVAYNNSTDEEFRAKIFTDHIYYPFYKLAENMIHTFKFYYMDVDKVEDLKHQIISVLYEEKIYRFDSTNGAKAFSYFGTIVKRWLINYNKKNYKKLKQVGDFTMVEDSYEEDLTLGENRQEHLGEFVTFYVNEMYTILPELFSKEQERKVADAVLTIFKTRHDIDIFKKKALYIYIREITDCETTHLTRVITKLKKEFYILYSYYHNVNEVGENIR